MPRKEVEIGGEIKTEYVDGGRGTPVDVVTEPTKELEKANTRFVSSDVAPKKTDVKSDLQVYGKLLDADGEEIKGGGVGEKVSADEIDSESATSGQVLTANGTGGASWQNPKEMDVVELTSTSGTLSDADYAKLLGDNVVIKAGTQYYYKDFDASTLLVFTAQTREGTNKVIVDQYEITKATKEYVLKSFNALQSTIGEQIEIVREIPYTSSYKIRFHTMADDPVGSLPTLYGKYTDRSEIVLSSQRTSCSQLYCNYFLKQLIETFTPATTGTISKTEADEYVQKIQSGWLCSYGGAGHQMRIVLYYGSAEIGETYLILQNLEVANAAGTSFEGLQITYEVNNDGTLTPTLTFDI